MKSSCLNYIYGVLRTLSFIFVAGVFASLAVYAADIDTGPFELEGNSLGGPTSGYTDTMDNPALPADDWSTYGPDQGLNCMPAAGAPEVILQVDTPLVTCGSASGPGGSDHHPGVDPQGDGHDGGGATRHLFVWDLLQDTDDQYWRGTKDTDLLEDRQIKLANPTSDKTNLHHTELAFYQNGTQQLFFKSTLLAQNGSAAFGLGLHQDSFSHDGSKFWRLDGDGNLTNVAPELKLGDVEVTMKLENGGGVVFVNAYVYVGESAIVNSSGKVVECLALTIDADPAIKAADNYCELEKSNITNWAIVATLDEARCDGVSSDDGAFIDQFACANVNEVATESADSKGYISKFPDKVPNLDAKGQEIDDFSHHPIYHNGDVTPLPAPLVGVIGDVFKIGFDDYPKTAVGEGGIDLTKFGLEGCFSTAVFASRSSHEISASSEDMTIGQLDLCSIKVTKDADTDISKVTDPVNYTITIENDGGISLYSNSIMDVGNTVGLKSWPGLGDLIKANNAPDFTTTCGDGQGEELVPGDTCTITVKRTVLGTDPNPMINEVTAIYVTGSNGIDGDAVTDSDTHQVDLFVPAVAVVKTEKNSTTVSTDGATVTYVYTITNNSSSTTLPDNEIPDLLLDGTNGVVDDVVGNLTVDATTNCGSLATGASCEFEVDYVIADLGDGLTDEKVFNEVDVLYHPDGFPNNVPASDDYTIYLFNPDVLVEKSGEDLTKAGDPDIGFDPVTYTFKVYNNTSGHSSLLASEIPDLMMESFVDDKLPGMAARAIAAGCDVLDESTNSTDGTACEFDVLVSFYKAGGTPDSDPNTLDIAVTGDGDAHPFAQLITNTVDVAYRPTGFDSVTHEATSQDSHTIDLFEPDYTLGLSCITQGAVAGQPITYEATITNTSSSNTPQLDLVSVVRSIQLENPLGEPTDITVLPGADTPPSLVDGTPVTVQFSGTSIAAGEYTGEIETVYGPFEYPNEVTRSDDATCIVAPAAGFFVLEKRLLEQQNIAFTFNVVVEGKAPAETILTPVFGNVEADTTVLSPVNKLVDGFDRGDQNEVDLALFTDTKTVEITELEVAGTRLVDAPIGIECDGGSAVADYTNRKVTITVGHDDTITCRMTNEELGRIKIDKITDPSGDPQKFDFSLTGGPSALNQVFQLDDDDPLHDSGYVIAGSNYVAAENNIPADWDLTDYYCDDSDSSVGNIVVGRGETVTCTFEDTKRGMITLVKTTIGGNDTFEYTHDVPGLDASLTTVGNFDSDDSDLLVPGTYSIAEDNYPGNIWEQSSAPFCSDGSPLNAIDVAPGEHVTCYFENGRKPELTLVKLVINDHSGSDTADLWELFATGTGGFSGFGTLAAPPADPYETKAVLGPMVVDPGVAYALSEDQRNLYHLGADWSCTGDIAGFVPGAPDDGLADITLQYGDEATCTIVNDDDLIEFCPLGSSSGRPELLIMSYDGESLFSDINTYLGGPEVQDFSGEVFVDPININPAPTQVDIKIIPSPQGDVEWALDVDIDELFAFENGKNGKVAPKTEFLIYDSTNVADGLPIDQRPHTDENWDQRVGFHTSCSQPLNVGQTYGLLTVEGGILGDGTVAGPFPLP